jgi:hypothetical protein
MLSCSWLINHITEEILQTKTVYRNVSYVLCYATISRTMNLLRFQPVMEIGAKMGTGRPLVPEAIYNAVVRNP